LLAVGEMDTVTLTLPLTLALRLALTLPQALGVRLTLCVGLCEALRELVMQPEVVSVPVEEVEMLRVPVLHTVELLEMDTLLVPLGLKVGERLAEGLEVGLLLRQRESVRLRLGVGEWEGVRVPVTLAEGHRDSVSVTVCEEERLGEEEVDGDRVLDTEAERHSVALGQEVADCEGLPEEVTESELQADTLRLKEPVAELEGEAVRHWDTVLEALMLEERHSVGLCDLLRVFEME